MLLQAVEFHVSTMSKVTVKLLVEESFVPMSAGTLCSGRQSPFLEVRFDRRLPRREAEHPWQARSDQSHIEQSATPSYGRDAFGLAKNSSV